MTPRMRTIAEAVAHIKSHDPHTAFTEHALRRMVRSGELPSVRIGAKYLVNLDVLLEFLATANQRANTFP